MKSLPLLLLLLGVGSAGCQKLYDKPRPYPIYEQREDFFTKVTEEEKTVENKEYPISITFKKNGAFTYDLPRLPNGTGTGVWKWDERGCLQLYAERTIFIMQMEVWAMHQKDPTKLEIEFTDRFGPKYLPLEIKE